MNDCRPWTQKSAPGIFCGQAEDARSMLLFATGFKRPRADKKTQGCRAALFVADYREGSQWQKFRHAAYGRTVGILAFGRMAYGRAYAARAGVWRTAAGGGECMGGECMGAAQVHGRHRCTGAHAHGRTGARAARIRRWAYRRVSSAPTGAKAYASGASSPAGRSFLPPSSRLVKLSGLMGRA